jgi:peptidoglycan/xylan/chitin deacetylase (PgdA/CDA1 family)
MKINFKIHSITHIVKSILGNIEFLFSTTKNESCSLFVVNYHGTQKKFISNFERQLIFFQKNYTLISPEQLDDFYSNKLEQKKYLLITFDDGVKNNLNAKNILDKYNIKAYFFIIPDFIDTVKEKQNDFFLRNIRPTINPAIDQNNEDFNSLTWEEIQDILKKEHGIGSHTKSHHLISNIASNTHSEQEIKDSKLLIEQKLNIKINSFCSINNTSESIGRKEKQIIEQNYEYHFTTFPGPNSPTSSKLLIKRANIESFWLLGAVKYALGSWDLKRWKRKIEEFESLI